MHASLFTCCFTAVVTALSTTAAPEHFVEYVESTGSQYIDLGVTASGHVRAEATVAWTGNPEDESLIAAREGETRYFLLHNTHQTISYGYNTFTRVAGETSPGEIYDIVSDFHPTFLTMTTNGIAIVSKSHSSPVNLEKTFYLFACNRDGTVDWKTSARVYRLKMWQNGKLVKDLKPCVKDGVAGFYDAVSGDFLSSATETPLVAGPEKVEKTPEAYLAYLDSDGSQYIDTGVMAMYGVKCELDAQMLEFYSSSSDMTLIGAYGDSRFYMLHLYHGILNYGLNDTFPKDEIYKFEKGKRITLTSEMDYGHQRICADGKTVFENDEVGYVEWPRTMYLWACHGSNGAHYPAKMRIYRAKIWQNGILVRDYVPCIYDRKTGLFDRVNGRFDASPAAFTADLCGPVTNIAESVRPDRFLEYVANNGSPERYVNTGIEAKSGVGMDTVMMWDVVPLDASYLAARHGNTRFYLYHYYESHILGYGDYYDYRTLVSATAGVKYRIHSFLDDGAQEITVDKMDSDGWKREAALSRTNAGLKNAEGALYLFACNNDGVANYAPKARCYSLKLYENGEPARDFVPASYAGIPMLWDRIGNRFYPSAGDRHLIGGPVKRRSMRVFIR